MILTSMSTIFLKVYCSIPGLMHSEFQTASYEARGFIGKHYLSAPIDDSHKIAVPYACSLYKTKVFVNEKPSVYFEFLEPGIMELDRAMIEIWWFDENYKPKCVVASVGKSSVYGIHLDKNIVYESGGSIKNLKKIGIWKTESKSVIFQLNSIEKSTPTVAIVRWMPDNLYKKYPNYFLLSTSTILLFGDTKSIVTPYLR